MCRSTHRGASCRAPAGPAAGHTLVSGVVQYLVDEVSHTTAASRPDVHAGTLADSVQALEVSQVVSPIQGLGLYSHLVALQIMVGQRARISGIIGQPTGRPRKPSRRVRQSRPPPPLSRAPSAVTAVAAP